MYIFTLVVYNMCIFMQDTFNRWLFLVTTASCELLSDKRVHSLLLHTKWPNKNKYKYKYNLVRHFAKQVNS